MKIIGVVNAHNLQKFVSMTNNDYKKDYPPF